MTTYMSPGVYIREVPSGPQPIAAVSASVMAIIGTTGRGPVLDPQRVTGWGDFVDRFGGHVADSFTAEAVSTFFENGGQAAYIVRADPSTASRWMVRDATGADVFEITAATPGAWSSDMTVVVTPSNGGGLARAWTSTVVSSAGDVVTVSSSAGLRIGNAITNGADAGTIAAISGNALTLEANVPGSWTDGANLAIAQNDTTIDLSSANGVEVGDLVRIEVPGANIAHSQVTALDVQTSGGARATMAPAANVPGGAVAPRTALYAGSLTAPGLSAVTLAQLDITGVELANADMIDGYQLVLANGQVARWAGTQFTLPGGAELPTGPVSLQAPIRVSLFEQDVPLDEPTLADLATLFAWVPDGSVLTLSPGNVAVTKDGDEFTVGDPADLEATFTSVAFTPTTASLLVTAPQAPLVGDIVDFDEDRTITDVAPIGGTRYQITVNAAPTVTDAGDRTGLATAFQSTRVVPERFSLSVNDGGIVEVFDNLSLADNHSRQHTRDGLVNENATLITVGDRLAAGALTAQNIPVDVASIATGTSEAAGAQDLIDGINELEREAEPAILICPDALTLDDPALQGSVIGSLTSHAEQFRRFAVVDTPRESNDKDLVDWRLEHVNSIYAAAYAPHVRILHLDGDAPERFRWVPPSGAIAGVFARTDAERGVHKAPANERVRGVVGLDVDYTQRRQDLLNPNGVNLIRSFPGRGRRVWGARNATTDTTWRYVNVRRLFNVIENSIEQGTQWVVFEPNTASTWLRVRVSVENFLNGLWTAGALAGNSPDEAYRVRVGLGETMTEAQVELGLVIIQVAIAAARPAEFVVFEFSHKRLSE